MTGCGRAADEESGSVEAMRQGEKDSRRCSEKNKNRGFSGRAGRLPEGKRGPAFPGRSRAWIGQKKKGRKKMADFVLNLSTRIAADEERKPLFHAAEVLRRDIRETLTGRGPENVIRVALDPTLGEEAYRAEVREEEIRLCCGDELGAVYGLLSVSEKFLGVKPLGWWMGLNPEKREKVLIPAQTWQSRAHRVRFRSWFINDEVLFTGWHLEENQRAEVWRRAFEALLRCGGNMVIPGTDREYDGTVLNEMALEWGLWITQHHSEILGARMFGRVYPTLTPSYAQYPEKYEALWQEAIDRYAGRKVVWAIGFRGQGDHAFWDDNDDGYDSDQKRGAFISSVMKRQMELVRKKDPDALFSTNLYGELMDLYRKGMLEVPGEVIRLWGDNGFGRMVSRRQENLNPRVDAMPGEGEPGRNGIYYHISFYDLQAANHITMLQIAPKKIAEELGRLLERGADTLWNINTGSIQPHLFMIDLIRRMWQSGTYDPDRAAAEFALDYYGTETAAGLLTGYAEAAVSYGPHEDDRAGDQYYHWPLRALARALMRGEWDRPVESMRWAAGDRPLREQVRVFAENVRPGIISWGEYARRCRDTEAGLPERAGKRIAQTMGLQGTIHRTGCEALYAFCQACAHEMDGRDLQAYLWTDRALQAAREGLRAMEETSGRFTHLYRNDCFVNVRLTVQVLESVRSWLRIRGDGERMYDWEKAYLTPESEKRVTLQSHRTCQLSDEEMCRLMRGEIEPEEAF